jgi:signal transduction histidine kinase
VRADSTKLRQVLLNLLSNAAKFTSSGRVELRVEKRGAELDFAVRDSGLGMTAEQLGRLFEPYVQAEETTQSRFGGTGLGLALSRRLARLMGGEIAVSSEPGRGSRFVLSLPGVDGC